MAAICDSNMRYFDLAADAAVHKSKQHAEWALMLDPLTSAVCCPAEVRELTKRLFEAEAQFLPGFN
jgi:alpha-galactosidase